jgi:hypothetical protein
LNKIDFVWLQIEVGGNAEQIGLLAGDVVVQVILLILSLFIRGLLKKIKHFVKVKK